LEEEERKKEKKKERKKQKTDPTTKPKQIIHTCPKHTLVLYARSLHMPCHCSKPLNE
jgi:hypothetical protein